MLLRYRVADNTPLISVSSQWSYRTKSGGAAGLSFGVVRGTSGGKVYTERLPSGFRNAPPRFRFCVSAQDASLNQSAKSCATYRFLP